MLHDASSYIFRVAELIRPTPDRLFSLSASWHNHRFRQVKPGRSSMFGGKKPTDEVNVRSRIFKYCVNQGDNPIVRPRGNMDYRQRREQDKEIQTEWWVKKVRENPVTSSCCVMLQSGTLEMIAEIEACRLHPRESGELTSLASARYCLNNNPAQTLKILKAAHYSSERWVKLGG